jgi:hypothetical protein
LNEPVAMMKPIPNLLGNSSHHQSDDDHDFVMGFGESQSTASTHDDGNSSNGSSAELSSPLLMSDQQRRRGKMMPRANSPRNVPQKGNADHPEQPKTPSRAGRRGKFPMDGATSMESVATTQSKPIKAPKTPGQPVRRGLLQKVGGSLRNVLAIRDEESEQAKKASTASSGPGMLKNTSGSMRNMFKGRSQQDGTGTAAAAALEQAPLSPRKLGLRRPHVQEHTTPATPGGSRPLKNVSKDVSDPSRNITTAAQPKTPKSRRSMMTKQSSLRKQHSTRSLSPSRGVVEPLTPKRSMFQKIGSLRNVLGTNNSKNSLGSDSCDHFDPQSVELSPPKPAPKQKGKTNATGQKRPSSPVKSKLQKPKIDALPSIPLRGGGKAAPLTVMCPSPTPKRLGFNGGSVNGSGSVCGSVPGSVQEEENRTAAIAARQQIRQQLDAIKHSLAPIQSPFLRNARKNDIPLLFPPGPDQSVSETIQSTHSFEENCVFDRLLGTKNHDSFGFNDSGWSMDMDDCSDEEETEVNPSPRPVPADPESNPGGESGTRLIALPGITVGKDSEDQSSHVSCLTEDGAECPATPNSRQVTLRRSTSARSVLAPPPLVDVDGCY